MTKINKHFIFYIYWTVHHLDSWVKRDQLDVTCFFISLFNDQYVSDVNTSILRSLRFICWVISWVVLLWYDACWCCVVLTSETCWALNSEIIKQVTPSWSIFIQLSRNEITEQISRKLLKMDVLTFETCWALNSEIINKWHQVGLSLFNYQEMK